MARSIAQGVASIAGSKVGAILISITVTPLLVNLLGSANYGDYSVIISLLGLTFIVIDGGLFDGLRKFIAEKPDSEQWRSEVFTLYFQYSLGIALFAFVIIALISLTDLPDQVFGAEFGTYFLLGGIILVGRQLFSLFRSLLHGLMEEHKAEPLRVVSQFTFGVLAIGLVYQGLSVTGVLIARITGLILVTGIAIYFSHRYLKTTDLLSRDYDLITPSRMFSFNMGTVVLSLLMESMYQLDVLLLQPIHGSSISGYYKAALVVCEFLWFVPNAIQTVFLHTSSQLWKEEQYEKITRLSSRSTRYSAVVLFLLVLGLAALAEPFMTTYYNPEFSRSVTPLLILLPGTLGFALVRPIFAIGQGKGSLKILIVATGASALINLVMNLLLIPPFGMVGAATATSLGYGSMLIFHIVAARRIGFDPLADLRPVRILVTAAASAVPIFWLAANIRSDLLALIVVPPTGFVIYSALAFTVGAVDTEDLNDLIEEYRTG